MTSTIARITIPPAPVDHIQAIANALLTGHHVWGGGSGVHPTTQGGFCLQHPSFEGEVVRRYFRDATKAARAYCKHVGQGIAEVSPYTPAPRREA